MGLPISKLNTEAQRWAVWPFTLSNFVNMKTFIVIFSTLESANLKWRLFPVSVKAESFEDAQEKAIDLVESKNLIHGAIISITRSL